MGKGNEPVSGAIICTACGKKVPHQGWEKHVHQNMLLHGVPLNCLRMSVPASAKSLPQKFSSMWGFDPFLPIRKKNAVSLGEGATPLVKLESYGKGLGIRNLYLKDEGKNPSCSFKDRGASLMASHAKLLGRKAMAIPSSGNAGIAVMRYANAAGMGSIVFAPRRISGAKLSALKKHADVHLEGENVSEAYRAYLDFVRGHPDAYCAFPVNNPFYFQGAATAALEIASQLGRAPDWVVVPCGGGNFLFSLYLGFKKLAEMKLVSKLPKLVCVQITGADPLVQGFAGRQFGKPVYLEHPAASSAEGVVARTSYNYFNVMEALRNCKGSTGVSVSDHEFQAAYARFLAAEKALAGEKHLYFEPSSQVVFAAVEKMAAKVKPGETVVLMGTGSEKK